MVVTWSTLTNRKLTTLWMDCNNKSFIDSIIPQLEESIQCFFGVCLTSNIVNKSYNPSKFVIIQPLDNEWNTIINCTNLFSLSWEIYATTRSRTILFSSKLHIIHNAHYLYHLLWHCARKTSYPFILELSYTFMISFFLFVVKV